MPHLMLVHDRGPHDPVTAYTKLYVDWMSESAALWFATCSLPWAIWMTRRV